jgi:hypothetical protein
MIKDDLKMFMKEVKHLNTKAMFLAKRMVAYIERTEARILQLEGALELERLGNVEKPAKDVEKIDL